MAIISDKMKSDNWDFFVEAKSGDPTHKIPGCENLIENLIASAEILEIKEHLELLKKCCVWSDRAHHLYYVEHDIHEAVRHCNFILREITKLIYEPEARYASVKSGAFKFAQPSKMNEV